MPDAEENRNSTIMPLRLYNTLSRRLQEFEPLDPPRVRIYACGPTIYDFAHIGNFRSFIVYDLLHRYLEWRGFEVRFVMNFTDVDDRTIHAAAQRGVRIDEFTPPFAEAILRDADALGIQRVDSYPRATDFVPQMVEFVERLVANGLAYPTEEGSVYFDISEFPEYGKLSGIDPDTVRSGARVAVDDYEKEDARDFALWKAAKPVDVETGAAWDSPWGLGRPGWHLECSVMGLSELGDTLDIHLGGEDLIFPHHEDEIAQSEGATGKPFARFWLHIKHLLLEGEKMSKSLGNTVSVQELVDEGFEPAAVRHRLLSAQYRSELNFTREGLRGSAAAIQRLVDFRERLREVPVSDSVQGTRVHQLIHEARESFQAALDDDLNAPNALAALFGFVREVNAELDHHPVIPPGDRDATLEVLASLDRVLGLLEVASAERALDSDLASWVEERIEARSEARVRRDFATADRIRDELAARGVLLEDTPQGTRWKVVRRGVEPS
jgi:cysteinyl-tRNA synthetase